MYTKSREREREWKNTMQPPAGRQQHSYKHKRVCFGFWPFLSLSLSLSNAVMTVDFYFLAHTVQNFFCPSQSFFLFFSFSSYFFSMCCLREREIERMTVGERNRERGNEIGEEVGSNQWKREFFLSRILSKNASLFLSQILSHIRNCSKIRNLDEKNSEIFFRNSF